MLTHKNLHQARAQDTFCWFCPPPPASSRGSTSLAQDMAWKVAPPPTVAYLSGVTLSSRKGLAIGPGTETGPPKALPGGALGPPPWSPLILTPALQKMGELPFDINIQEPRWDQSTFLGRARHFFTVTDPRNLLLSGAQLEAARNTVQNYR